MDRNLEQRDLGKSTANEIPKRGSDGREKSNKCIQCDYVSSRARDLRKHLKTHSGEKSLIHSRKISKNCEKRDNVPIQAGSLKTNTEEQQNKVKSEIAPIIKNWTHALETHMMKM